MQLNTKHFGSIEIDEEGIIFFNNGIPGFDRAKEFILLGSSEDSPFKWLQCVDFPELAFVVVDPFLIKADYDIVIEDDVMDTLGIENKEEVLVLSIVVVPEDISKMTMNLQAPLIINSKKHLGMQVTLDTDQYNVRHLILDELRKQEVAANVGSNKEEGSDYSNK